MRAGALLGVVIIAVLAFRAAGLQRLLDGPEGVEALLGTRGPTEMALLAGLGGFGEAVGLPRPAVDLLCGYAFGIQRGFLVSLIASILGCALSFIVSRLLARELVLHWFGNRVGKLDALLSRHPFLIAFALRLSPVGHNLTTNLVAGVTSVRTLPFLAGSTLGYLPQEAGYVLVGSGVEMHPALRIGIAAALLLGSLGVAAWLWRKLRLRD